MKTLAKLASGLNWPRTRRAPHPTYVLITDQNRLADPFPVFDRLPRGAIVILRHTDRSALTDLAQRLLPRARRLGLKVVIAGDVRDALRLKCDGIHLSERRARRGPVRPHATKPGFLITAAAHDRLGLWRAALAGADHVLLSPVFPTASHPERRALGPLRFARLAASATCPVIALGGIDPVQVRRVSLSPAHGLAAIAGWQW